MDAGVAWGRHLGLAPTQLFGSEPAFRPQGSHFALLDGVSASFLLSDVEGPIDPRIAATWAWSANVRTHVARDKSLVSVVRVSNQTSRADQFSRKDVESRLEAFLDFLVSDRRASQHDVVEMMLRTLHKVRARAYEGNPNLSAAQTLEAFLLLAAGRVEGDQYRHATSAEWIALATRYGISREATETLGNPSSELRDFNASLDLGSIGLNDLELGVAIRHAGGAIFQQATAALNTWGQVGLFDGYVETVAGHPDLSLGAFFTPPGLARSLAEICLEPFVDNDELSVADFACGSGVFLTEAIRALQRRGFDGKLTVIGMDVSPAAIAAARFAIACAKMDSPSLDLTVRLTVGDALAEGPLEAADVVLMNPPFRSWEAMGAADKARVKAVLGSLYKNKADLCMAIARKAFDSLKAGGCFGSLLPVGVLASESAEAWRDYFAAQGRLRNLAALGDHSLFRYATVNMGMVVVDKAEPTAPKRPVTMIWADESVDAASSALRSLRKKLGGEQLDVSRGRSWCIYNLDASEIERRHTWLPRPNALSHLIGEIRLRNTSTLGELFDLRQGARAGLRRAFILSDDQVAELPENERAGFRPVAENDTLRRGHILRGRLAFYPPEAITSEEDLTEQYPEYFKRYLKPNRQELSKRSGIQAWWEMTRARRSWQGMPKPKIITPMFAGPQSFALDADGDHVVCQGWAWLPRRAAQERAPRDDDKLRALKLYCALFNTQFFFQLVREFSTNVAGGQIDMSPKYIATIPCPTWSQIAERLLSVPNANVVESREPLDEAVSPAFTMPQEVALRLYGMSSATDLGVNANG